MTISSKALKYRYKFWNAVYKYAQKKRERILDERFTRLPDGVTGYEIKTNGGLGILDDPPGTPTPVMPIIPIEVEIRKSGKQ